MAVALITPGAAPADLPPADAAPDGWAAITARLAYAFQPIVNIHTGRCCGVEALLRGVEAVGFADIPALFDAAWRDGTLPQLDALLFEKAARSYAALPGAGRMKLFYNLDNRLIAQEPTAPERSYAALKRLGLDHHLLVLELSESHDLDKADQTEATLKRYRAHGFKLALDDYGSGYAQLRVQFASEPDIIKIDRFFVSGIQHDRRKELFVAHIVNFAHMLGAQVVAEGVETEGEYLACLRAGCDLVQGYFIARPSRNRDRISTLYTTVATLGRRARRRDNDRDLLRAHMSALPPLAVDSPPLAVLDFFKSNLSATLAPVIDTAGQPLGVIRETDIKAYSYTPYGRDLLQNRSAQGGLERFVARCPVVDLSTSLDLLLEAAATTDRLEGMILTDQARYVGLLDNKALLTVISARNTLAARDQNPLTRLPGNSAIHRRVSEFLARPRQRRYLVYFDLDHFKPFNDLYGFRQGDRALLLFADLLGKHLRRRDWFVGHVGGDDFFAYLQTEDYGDAERRVRDLCGAFADEIRSFYDADARKRGYVIGRTRTGDVAPLALMTASAAVLQLPPERVDLTLDDAAPLIAELKRIAKQSPNRYCAAGLWMPPARS